MVPVTFSPDCSVTVTVVGFNATGGDRQPAVPGINPSLEDLARR
jgi:hypothetical protein